MQEQIDFLIGELRSSLRFRWIGLLIAALGCAAGWAYVAYLPNVYEAQARFFLNTSSLLERTMEDQIVATDPNSRLAFIRESLFGRTELEAVARQVGLDAGLETEIEYEIMLNQLRERVVFESLTPEVTAGSRDSGDRVFLLRYRNTDRQKAFAVVDALLNTFIEGALGESRQDEDDAFASLARQIELANAEVNEAEKELSDFKRENADQLPGAQGDFQQRMQTAELALAAARRNLSSLESRLQQHQREIENLRRFLPDSSATIAPNSLPVRLRNYQLEYDEKRLRLQPSHPDMLELESNIANLTRQIEEERRAQGSDFIDPNVLSIEANPVYQEAQIARAETELAIAERRAEIEDLTEEIAALQELRDESLANEAALGDLERNVEDASEQLAALVESRRTLERTMAVESSGPIRFRAIDEPFASRIPVEPARLKLLLVVFVGSLGLGAASCYVLAQIYPVFTNARTLQQFAELPVLGAVTNAWPAAEHSAYRRSVVAFFLALLVLVAGLAGLALIELLGPGIHAPFAGD